MKIFYVCTHKFPPNKSNLLVLACAFNLQFAETVNLCWKLHKTSCIIIDINVSVG